MPFSSRLDFHQYVSVDVLSITDDFKTTTIPPSEHFIFYSTELLAIILRSKQGGLVTTELIVWTGKHCSEDGREKVQELEKRYRSTAKYVEQGKESLQLVKALGGRLVTRQGFRSTFDVLNSTLYRVQSRGRGVSFIDEVELQASSLCSAYSYIASVFQDLFVWYGRGTPDEESRVALQYAEELARAGTGPKRKIAHMLEGAESDLWRDIMGHEEEYAFANHWRFRLENSAVAQVATQFYEVNVSSDASHIRTLGNETACSLSDRGVYVVRTPLECFVLVTPSARGNSRKIAAALHAAASMLDTHPTANLPYRPTLHTLVLPSLIPRDLGATLRSTILEDLNAPYQPSTMNVVDETTAWEHLGRETFYTSEILDEALLPVGVAPETLQ
ncbi:hypothetical protein P389DRAFT_71575 [Cystobasidium minutum MCA 4210]|uniref:uncharacterized protein n=1 Tax=Cystobasidium minutum MCA 4210 TaxID=1397322 RepID=UPI0034CF5599|eukprot:jgi/Rhomi1/71575/CE71574_1099